MAAALGRPVETGDPIAFDVTDRAFLDAYFDVLHRGLEDDGVDFWWLDWQSGPHSRVVGIDPLWMLNHFHFLDSARDGRRPLTFSRFAGPGSHRYPVGFSGDAVISWASLAFQPHFTATAANIGYGWWSHDIGGHMFGAKDDELATRWVQLGVFSPILRLHSTSDAFTTKEPWSFGPEARAVQTAHLRLRHRLVPYLHTMNHRAARDGRPLVEPLYHAWPEAPEAYEAPNQFLFGSELMVAAITEPADPRTRPASVRAWLPDGTWVDVLTGLVYDGGRQMLLHRDLATHPGARTSRDAARPRRRRGARQRSGQPVTARGAGRRRRRRSFMLVEDDGTDAGTVRTALAFDQESGTLTVAPAVRADRLPARDPARGRSRSSRSTAPPDRGRRRRDSSDGAPGRSGLGDGRRRPGRRARSPYPSAPDRSSPRTTCPPACSPCWTAHRSLRPEDPHPGDRHVRSAAVRPHLATCRRSRWNLRWPRRSARSCWPAPDRPARASRTT